ncbi:MAG: nitrite/sulfite reductase [Thermoanaerobaculia bacterium]
MAEEIDVFETQIELKRQGKLDDKIFAETRLRRGVYGQRYDNGKRHDGTANRPLAYPCGDLTKGPNTVWDAPGMHRIKIPFGEITADQMDVLADLAEEYSDSICHVTTRQDFQYHFIHIDDTPDLMRRLAAVGITTREACGNVVRNVTGCPRSGVCGDESFDVTPYAKALSAFLLGHPDAQDFGRKFKISFSGCSQHACALAHMHDLGYVAKTRIENSVAERGFEVYAGGGLGAVPHRARIFAEFLPVAELLPAAQAICRVFARLGEKKNRGRARLKFLIAKLGIEEFQRLVDEERAELPVDPRWTELLPSVTPAGEIPIRPSSPGPVSPEVAGPFVEAYDAWQARQDGPVAEAAPIPGGSHPEGFGAWVTTNVESQRQSGYFTATVNLPLGDLTSRQMRDFAEQSRRFSGGVARTTVEQNMMLRWVSGADLPDLYRELRAFGLARPGAGTIVDITSCPGTDTCKLGISSSRGLAAELSRRLAERAFELDAAVKGLRIKVSGCFNSCGQHHVADIGFYGVSRKAGNHTVPHFQVILGGQWSGNAAAYGLAVGAVPSKNIPLALTRITDHYLGNRESGESFQDFVRRIGKAEIKQQLAELMRIPDYQEDATFYSDWGDAREYTIQDLGVGECAGEVVSVADFGLAESERVAFEAQLALDQGDDAEAGRKAYRAMLEAAKAITQTEKPDVTDDPEEIVREFKVRFHDTARFHDPFAGAKFANYLFRAHGEDGNGGFNADDARRRVEEAQLFIEAAHACHTRLAAGA